MIRRHVLAALAEGIAAGHDDAARAAIEHTEWVLRGPARRRLERALIDAALASNEPNSFRDPEAARHVHRVAALDLAGVPIVPTDREAVAATYAKLPRARAPRAPIGAIALVGVMLVLAAAFATVVVVMKPSAAEEKTEGGARSEKTVDAYVRPLPPPVAGAFQTGGVPFGDPALETLLVEEFTNFIIAASNDSFARRNYDYPAGLAKLREAPAIKARGDGLVRAWNDMLDMIDMYASGDELAGERKEVSREFRGKVTVVSDQLAAAGIGVYLEGLVRKNGERQAAIVYTYKVEEVVYVRAGSAKRRVLTLRRLDELNRSWGLLGMHSDELGDPMVLLDKVEQHVASKVLPLLAADARFELGEDWQEARPLEVLVGRSVRDELLAAYGPEAGRAGAIAALLVERGTIIDRWRTSLRLTRLESLYMPEALFDQLAGRVPKQELDRVKAIEQELAVLEAKRISTRVVDLIAASVRRHEAQHGFDADRDTPLRYPPALEAYLGPELDSDNAPRRSVESARHELSAYLSQIANDPATTRNSLWHVARAVFDKRMWGSAESYAGVLIIEGLARHLGVTAEQPVIESGAIVRKRLLAPAQALVNAPAEKLRASARALWLELFGEEMVPIVDR